MPETKKNSEEKKTVVKKDEDKSLSVKNRELYQKVKSEKKVEESIRYDTGVAKNKVYKIRTYSTGKNTKGVIKRTLVGITTIGGKKKGTVVK